MQMFGVILFLRLKNNIKRLILKHKTQNFGVIVFLRLQNNIKRLILKHNTHNFEVILFLRLQNNIKLLILKHNMQNSRVIPFLKLQNNTKISHFAQFKCCFVARERLPRKTARFVLKTGVLFNLFCVWILF